MNGAAVSAPPAPPAGARAWLWHLGPPLLLILAVAAVYGPCVTFPFTNWDDAIFIAGNPLLRELSLDHLARILRPGGVPQEMLYIPVTYLSYLLDAQCFGLAPWAVHAENLLLHAGNAVLAWLLLLRLLDGDRRGALLGAALFALHPLQAETVAWAMGRKDLLAAAAGLLCLLAWLRYRDTADSLWLLLALGSFAAGALAKPTLIVWPALLVWLDLHRGQRLGAADCRRLIPFLLVALLVYFLNTLVPQEPHPQAPAPLARALALPWLLAGWAQRLLLLQSPLPFYPWPEPGQWRAVYWQGGLALAALLLLAGWVWRCRARRLAFGLLFGAIAFAPAVLAALEYREFVTADRYGYLPMLGLGYLFGLTRPWLNGRWALAWRLAVSAFLLAAAWLAARQTQVWRSSAGIWQPVVAQYPRQVLPLHNLALAEAEAGRLAVAETLFRQGLALAPDHAEMHANLGLVCLRQGRAEEAFTELRQAVLRHPGAKTFHALAQACEKSGRQPEAVEACLEALRRNPALQDAYLTLGAIYLRQGLLTDARATLERGARLGRHAELQFNLGLVCERLGDSARAANAYQLAVQIAPDFADAYYNLGNLYLQRGDWELARQQFQAVLAVRPEQAAAHVNLGIAWFQAGQPAAAEKALRRGLALDDGLANGHFLLAQVCRARGDTAAATRELARALQLQPALRQNPHPLKDLEPAALQLLAP